MVKTSKKAKATRSRQTKQKCIKDEISESSDIGVPAGERTFRFLDLPKELQLRIYKMAFEPSGRQASFRIFKQAFNVTHAMQPNFSGRRHSTHPLLLLNSATHKEAMSEFYKNSVIDMRYHADWSWEDSEVNSKAMCLGPINKCSVFGQIKNLLLQIHLDDVTDFDAFVFGLRKLINSLHRGRFLDCLDITIFASWDAEDSPNSAQARFLMGALASFACKGSVEVEWNDGKATDAFQWVPHEFRIMALEMEETITLRAVK